MSWLRELIVTPECVGCGQLGTAICRGCQFELRPFTICEDELNVRCISDYSGWLRERLIEYKNGAAHLARPLAQLMTVHISPTALLVPIPTSRAKIHARRFDTIAVLCRELARLEPNRTVIAGLRLVRDVQDQVGLSETQRRTNLAHAFMATRNIVREVVVVDDVVTTGATLREAQRALKIAGARDVSAAVLCGSHKKRYG